MKKAGPPMARLVSRLAQTPDIFLSDPVMTGGKSKLKGVDVSAVVADLVFDIDGKFPGREEVARFKPGKSDGNRNWLGTVLVLSCLLHDPFFIGQKGLGESLPDFFCSDRIKKLAGLVEFREFVTDTDKREELARLALDGLGFLPEGEGEKLAKDRLRTLDTVERERILEKTREAQARARRLREEMARSEAEEAASKMGRE